MYYDFKCSICKKVKEFNIPVNDYDKIRPTIKCCKAPMDRDYRPIGIKTTSSPNRY